MSYKLHSHKKCYVSMAILRVFSKIVHLNLWFFTNYVMFTLQLQIFVIINFFFFHTALSIIQSSNWPGKFSQRIFFSRLNTFAAVDIQPPSKTLFFRLMFSTCFIDFEKVFKIGLSPSKKKKLFASMTAC